MRKYIVKSLAYSKANNRHIDIRSLGEVGVFAVKVLKYLCV